MEVRAEAMPGSSALPQQVTRTGTQGVLPNNGAVPGAQVGAGTQHSGAAHTHAGHTAQDTQKYWVHNTGHTAQDTQSAHPGLTIHHTEQDTHCRAHSTWHTTQDTQHRPHTTGHTAHHTGHSTGHTA